jgi:hypothetical protein
MADSGGGGNQPLQLWLEPAEIEIAPGGSAQTATVYVRNMGPDVDQFSVEVAGLDPSWYTAETTAVALFPGDAMPLTVSIHPPPGAAQPGRYPFGIVARSQTNPNIGAQANGTLAIMGSRAFRSELAPQRVTAHTGKYRLTLHNGLPAPLPLEVTGYDERSQLAFRFSNPRPLVPASGRLVVPFTAKPKQATFFGQTRAYRFNVAARPAGGSDADWKVSSGELMHTPRVAFWMIPALLVALLIPLVAFLAVSGCWFCTAQTVAQAATPTPVPEVTEEPTPEPTEFADPPTFTPVPEPTATEIALLPTFTAEPTPCALAVMEHRDTRDTRIPPGLAAPEPYRIGDKTYTHRAEYVSPMFVEQSGVIDKIIVGRVDIFKVDWTGDGLITGHITSPDGRRTRLFNWECGPGGALGMHITLDDGAETGIPYSCTENFAGVFKPDYGPLSTFADTQSRGNWVLQVEAYTNQESSAAFFNKWELELCLRP